MAASDIAQEFERAAVELLGSQMSRDTVRGQIERTGWSESLWSSVTEAGWLDVLLSEDLGGLGLGITELAGIFQVVGRYLMPGPVFDNAVALALAANQSPRSGPAVDAIHARRTIALADGASSQQPTDARPQLRGGRLFGSGDLVRYAAVADDLLVVVERPQPTIVMVATDAPGVTLDSYVPFDNANPCARVDFDGVDCVCLFADDGADNDARTSSLIADLRNAARLLASFEIAGTSRQLLDSAVLYAKERHQFGRPIGGFQAIQHLLADLAVRQVTLEAVCEQTLDTWEARPQQRHRACATAKATAAQVGRTVAEGALQVHGGIAFTRELALHRWVTHALTLQGLYGDHRTIAAELGQALTEPAHTPHCTTG